MQTIPSVQAQNNFGNLIDTAQREIVSVTRHGRIAAYVMSPRVLEDLLDSYLALEAEKGGMLTPQETEAFLKQLRDA